MPSASPFRLFVFLLFSSLMACQSDTAESSTSTITESAATMNTSSGFDLFIGTYTRKEGHVHGKAEGIYWYQMNAETGALQHIATAAGALNPSYVAVHPSGDYLYAIHEHGQEDNYPTGTISAYSVDREKKQLTLLNRLSAKGDAPCHISVDPKGRAVFVANYVGGNIAMLPIADDGRLLEKTAMIQHEGKGSHPRQEAPHAHQIIPNPSNELVYVCDLGINAVKVYATDYEAMTLSPTQTMLKPAWRATESLDTVQDT